MAFDFPSAPVEGQVFGSYVWDGEKWIVADTGNAIFISETPPPNPIQGAQWFDSTDGAIYVWYNDGTSAQWVQVNGVAAENFVSRAGDSMVGDLTISKGFPVITLNDIGGNFGVLRASADGLVKWDLSLAWPDSGGHWCSFDRYAADQSYIDSPLTLSGVDGSVILENRLHCPAITVSSGVGLERHIRLNSTVSGDAGLKLCKDNVEKWDVGNAGADDSMFFYSYTAATFIAKLAAASPVGQNTGIAIIYSNGSTVQFQTVSVGAADSGGAGFRLLRVPN